MDKPKDLLLPAATVLLIVAAGLVALQPEFYRFPIFAINLSISAALTLLDYYYSNKAALDNAYHSGYHRHMTDHRKKLREARKTRTHRILHANACSLANYCAILTKMGGGSAWARGPKWPQFRDEFAALHCDATVTASALGRILRDADFLDDQTRDAVADAAGHLGEAALINDGERTVDIWRYQAALESLDLVLALLRRRRGAAAAAPLHRPRPAPASGGMALRLDCDTYPPDAAICAMVESDNLLPHHEVTVTVLGEGLGRLAKETEAAPPWAPRRHAALPINLRPEGLETGREYTALAECGGLVATAAFAVDDIGPAAAPAVHAHGPTCTAGGYMDITVVDPAACAGGAESEPAGAAKGPRLAIELPCGETKELRLEEAHRSDGALHWRVGCEVDGGRAAPRDALGGGRAGAGGGGAENAAVACEPLQLIRIRYESAAGDACTAVLVEEIGASSVAIAAGVGPLPPAEATDRAGRQQANATAAGATTMPRPSCTAAKGTGPAACGAAPVDGEGGGND